MNMKSYHRNYKGQKLCMSILLALVLALAVLNLLPEKGIEPDAVYPMANANVTWSQTFHSGGWTE